jgi:hypothetical protein
MSDVEPFLTMRCAPNKPNLTLSQTMAKPRAEETNDLVNDSVIRSIPMDAVALVSRLSPRISKLV